MSPRYTFTYLMNGHGLRGEGRLQSPSHGGHLGAQLVTSTTSFGTGKHPYLLPEEHDNMVPVYATTRKPSVLTLLLKQTPLLWKRSWIKQLVWQRKTSASEAFLFRKTLRKGCELQIHTSTNTSPTPCGQCHMGADTFQTRAYIPGRCGWLSCAGGASTGIIFWIVSTFPF